MLYTNFEQGYFGFDEGPDYFGYTDPSDTWNGWSQPYFPRQVIEKVVADLNAESDGTKLTIVETGELIVDESAFYDEEAINVITPIETEHGTLWPLISGWSWSGRRDAPTDYEYVNENGERVDPRA